MYLLYSVAPSKLRHYPSVLGEKDQVWCRDTSRNVKEDVSYFQALIKCCVHSVYLGTWGSGRINSLPWKRGNTHYCLVCAKASALTWQQKYWGSYLWHPVCPWNIYSTVTVWTLCSHCIICLETWNTQVDFLRAVGSADTTRNTPCPSFCSNWCVCTQWLERDLIGLRGSIYQGTRLKYRLHMTSNL